MEREKMKNQSNVIDAFEIRVERGSYDARGIIPTSKYDHIHAGIDRKTGELKLRVGAKVLMTPNDLGSITSISDMGKLPTLIERCTGVKISTGAMFKSRLTALEVKKDVHFSEPLEDVLSALREMSSISTNKQEVLTYYNDVGYKNSILIKSTSKSVKDSLCIYNKLYEMWLKRKKDCGYYFSFSHELKENYKNVLRFERKIRWASALRKALKLPEKEKVTLQHVFDSPYNLVGEKVKGLIGYEIGGSK